MWLFQQLGCPGCRHYFHTGLEKKKVALINAPTGIVIIAKQKENDELCKQCIRFLVGHHIVVLHFVVFNTIVIAFDGKVPEHARMSAAISRSAHAGDEVAMIS